MKIQRKAKDKSTATMKTTTAIVFTLSLISLALSFAAAGEVPNSHLVCHQVKLSSVLLKKIQATLVANKQQGEFTLQSCKLASSYVDLCVPATKEVESGFNMPEEINDIVPQQLTTDYLCYNLKCKGLNKDFNKKVANQFGLLKFWVLGKKSRKRMCVPTWKLKKGKPILIKS